MIMAACSLLWGITVEPDVLLRCLGKCERKRKPITQAALSCLSMQWLCNGYAMETWDLACTLGAKCEILHT